MRHSFTIYIPIGRLSFQPKKNRSGMQESVSSKFCDFCKAEEEKRCPIGGFVVKLNPLYMCGEKKTGLSKLLA